MTHASLDAIGQLQDRVLDILLSSAMTEHHPSQPKNHTGPLEIFSVLPIRDSRTVLYFDYLFQNQIGKRIAYFVFWFKTNLVLVTTDVKI